MIRRTLLWNRWGLPWPPSRQGGQGLVEYSLVIALIALAAMSAVLAFGQGLNDALYSHIISRLQDAL